MNQRPPWNIAHVNADVNLMTKNVTQEKNKTIVSVRVSVKNQKNIAHVESTSSWILVHVLASVTKIVRFPSSWKTEYIKSLFDDLGVICDEIVDTPESASINSNDGMNYWLIAVIPLSIACLLLLVVISFLSIILNTD